jgi:DNA-binding transcriptional MerR regulator
MTQLQDLAQHQPYWSLEEFVQVANQLLPEVLPDERANTRVREEVTSRLVRHYTTQGMIEEPLKQGREARYHYRHLLQVLMLRRLLTAGYGAGAIAQFAIDRTNSELETLLQGDLKLTITSTPSAPVHSESVSTQSTNSRSVSTCSDPASTAASSSALEFLQQLQTRATPPAIPPTLAAPIPQPSVPLPRQRPQTAPPSSQSHATRWTRIELAPGLEIHVSEQFSYPLDALKQQQLLARILQFLQSNPNPGEIS